MNDLPYFDVVYGNSTNMAILRNNEVDLVVTAPPLLPSELSNKLKSPIKNTESYKQVLEEITEYALSLLPVYKEITRVLKREGYLVIQISDLQYGGIILPITKTHLQMAENCGFNLVNKFYWLKEPLPASTMGGWVTQPLEDIHVFSKGYPTVKDTAKLSLSEKEKKKYLNPIWKISSENKPEQSPKELVRRVISLYSKKRDLVLDPFSGTGTSLKIALKMGRKAVGYEINPDLAQNIRKELKS